MALSMTKKINIGFVVIVFLAALLGVTAYLELQYSDNAHTHAEAMLMQDMRLDETVKDHIVWVHDLARALLTKNKFESPFKAENCGFGDWISKFKLENPVAARLVGDLAEAHSELNQKFSKTLELYEKGLGVEAAAFYAEGIVPAIEKFESLSEKISELSNAAVMEDIAEQERRSLRAKLILIATALLTLLISISVAVFVYMTIHRVVVKLADATNQVTSASTEILAASQEQASGAREQSSAVTETTSAAKELSTTSEVVGDSIKKVAQVAAHALSGMAKIKEAIDKTNGMLTSLGEKSQKIGKITELIDDVADQTNLLAVNASIEAARAGEQGRGFTVVADEIRKLADSTAKSTKDITSLIELIQHEMSNAIMSMETSVSSVDEEARLAQQTTEKAKEIAMSANQQISGAKQIAEAMLNIDEAMKQIAAGAQQSQTAARQLQELATGLKNLMILLK